MIMINLADKCQNFSWFQPVYLINPCLQSLFKNSCDISRNFFDSSTTKPSPPCHSVGEEGKWDTTGAEISRIFWNAPLKLLQYDVDRNMKLAHWLGMWKVLSILQSILQSIEPSASFQGKQCLRAPDCLLCLELSQPLPLQYPNISWELFYSNQRERGQPHPHTSPAGVWTEKISTLERKLDLRLTNLDLLFIENVSLLIAATGGILTGWTIELLTEFRETFGKGPW